jgi:ABC-type nitrate/sulfonate/bicarbonate transport system permease component
MVRLGRFLGGSGPLLGAAVLVLVAWQAWVSLSGLEAIVLPGPGQVLGDLVTHPEAYVPDTASTLLVACLGLALGMSLGVALAVVASLSPFFGGLITPAALLIRSVPFVALIPVIARVAGYNERSLVVIATLIAFFPSYVLTVSGLRAPPPGAADLFSVLGASRAVRLLRLALPSAVPNVFVAFRLAASFCILGAVAGEYLMGTAGLGRLMVRSRTDGLTERAFGVAVLVAVLSVGAFLLATKLESWGKERWR